MTAVWPYASIAPDVSSGAPVYPTLPSGVESFSVESHGGGGSSVLSWLASRLKLGFLKAICDQVPNLSTPVWQMPIDYVVIAPGGGSFALDTNGALNASGLGSQATVLLPLTKAHIGQPITDVLARINQGGGTNVVVEVYKVTGLSSTGGAPTSTLVATATSPGAGHQLLTLTPGSPVTLTTDQMLMVKWKPSNGGDALYGLRFD